MGADYAKADYVRLYILVALGLLLLMLLAIVVGRCLQRRWKRYYVAIIPTIIWVGVFWLVSIGWLLKSIEYADCLFIGGPQDTYEYAGTVTDMQITEKLPSFYAQGKLRTGAVAEIGDKTFHVLADGKLQPGMTVAVTYVPEDNLILHWHTVTPQEAEAIVAAIVPEPVEEMTPVPSETPEVKLQFSKQMEFAIELIHWFGMIGSAAMYCLVYLFPARFTTYCLQKDETTEQGTKPHLWGFILSLSPWILFGIGIAASMMGSGEITELIVFLVIALTVLIFLYFYKTKRITLRGRYMVLRRFGREKKIPLELVAKVEWVHDRRTFDLRMLKIWIRGQKSIELEQAFHCGLFDLYRRLSVYTERTP